MSLSSTTDLLRQERNGDIEYIRLNTLIATDLKRLRDLLGTHGRFVEVLGTPQEPVGTRDRMRNLADEACEIMHNTTVCLKQLSQAGAGQTLAEGMQRRAQYNKLYTDFASLVQRFRELQQATEAAAETEDTQVRSTLPALDDTAEECRALLADAEADAERHRAWQQRYAQLLLDNDRSAPVAKRPEHIGKLQHDRGEVNSLLREVAALVEMQQPAMDTVTASVFAEDGADELAASAAERRAARQQRQCWCILGGALAVIVTIVLVVTKATS